MMASTEVPKDSKLEEVSTTGTPPIDDVSNDVSEKAARRLLWKVDLWILPTLTIVYLLSAMDRSDIGNAQVVGMQKAVGASNSQWAQVVSLFYVGFILGQPVGSFFLRKLTPPVIMSIAVLMWGLMTILLIKTTVWSQAAGVRICIGFAEGMTHAAPLYLSLWYTPKELATRGGIFFSASSLAGAFNGLIAYAIVNNYKHSPPFASWQWLLFIEGLVSVTYGLFVLVLIPPVPEKVKWGFTAMEKNMAVVRTLQANNTPGATIHWNRVFRIFTSSPMVYVYTIILTGSQIAQTGLSSFLPSIITGMGYTSVQAQLMTVPVYAVSFVASIVFPYASDKSGRRGLWLIGLSIASLIGFIIMIAATGNNAARYAGLCIGAMGQFPSLVICLAWLASNNRNFTDRAAASAVVNVVALAVSLGVLQTYKDPPYYKTGLAIAIAFIVIQPFAATFGIWYVKRVNAKKVAVRNEPATVELRQKSLEELGSAHPDYFWQE